MSRKEKSALWRNGNVANVAQPSLGSTSTIQLWEKQTFALKILMQHRSAWARDMVPFMQGKAWKTSGYCSCDSFCLVSLLWAEYNSVRWSGCCWTWQDSMVHIEAEAWGLMQTLKDTSARIRSNTHGCLDCSPTQPQRALTEWPWEEPQREKPTQQEQNDEGVDFISFNKGKILDIHSYDRTRPSFTFALMCHV